MSTYCKHGLLMHACDVCWRDTVNFNYVGLQKSRDAVVARIADDLSTWLGFLVSDQWGDFIDDQHRDHPPDDLKKLIALVEQLRDAAELEATGSKVKVEVVSPPWPR